jgi:PhnB protein
MAFRPYLFFGGNCREAFTRYQEILGGELTLLTMKDVPGEEPLTENADMIIHAAVVIGDDLLMASDDPTTDRFGTPWMINGPHPRQPPS